MSGSAQPMSAISTSAADQADPSSAAPVATAPYLETPIARKNIDKPSTNDGVLVGDGDAVASSDGIDPIYWKRMAAARWMLALPELIAGSVLRHGASADIARTWRIGCARGARP